MTDIVGHIKITKYDSYCGTEGHAFKLLKIKQTLK